MMQRSKLMLVIGAFTVILPLAWQSWLLLREARRTCEEATATVREVRWAAASLRVQADEQLARFKDPRNSKAIDAGLQTMAVWNATGRLVNTQLIPRAMRTIDNLEASAASFNTLIQGTDRRINADLLPETARTIRESGATVEQARVSLQEMSARTNQSLDALHALLSDPAWHLTLNEVRAASQNVRETTAEIREASRQMPLIAADLERMAGTAKKWQAPLAVARIFSLIGWAFVP